MAIVHREVFFIDAPLGGRFCLVTHPRGEPVGGLLHVHPFAEEMNKSRRMAALGARAFAERGWMVLQPDLLGCGDSGGEFGDATWQDWVDDVARAWSWLAARCPAPLALWTLRAGSLLAADWLARGQAAPPMLMWQPVTNGRQHLTQFLRLKAASEMLADADAKAAMTRLRAGLEAGETAEVAGYAVSPGLAAGLEAAALKLPAGYRAPVAMVETSSGERAEPSPALAALAGRWTDAGIPVALDAVAGPAFWQTLEIETAPALVERSVAALEKFVR